MSNEMMRQGDLLFVKCEEIPAEAGKAPDGIIARGEITGHHHRLSPGCKATLMIAAGVAYVNAEKQSTVIHEEHDTVTLPQGCWKVIRQSEYQPEGWRRVAD